MAEPSSQEVEDHEPNMFSWVLESDRTYNPTGDTEQHQNQSKHKPAFHFIVHKDMPTMLSSLLEWRKCTFVPIFHTAVTKRDLHALFLQRNV